MPAKKNSVKMSCLPEILRDVSSNHCIRRVNHYKIWFDWPEVQKCYNFQTSRRSFLHNLRTNYQWRQTCGCEDENCGDRVSEEGFWMHLYLRDGLVERIEDIPHTSHIESLGLPKIPKVVQISPPIRLRRIQNTMSTDSDGSDRAPLSSPDSVVQTTFMDVPNGGFGNTNLSPSDRSAHLFDTPSNSSTSSLLSSATHTPEPQQSNTISAFSFNPPPLQKNPQNLPPVTMNSMATQTPPVRSTTFPQRLENPCFGARTPTPSTPLPPAIQSQIPQNATSMEVCRNESQQVSNAKRQMMLEILKAKLFYDQIARQNQPKPQQAQQAQQNLSTARNFSAGTTPPNLNSTNFNQQHINQPTNFVPTCGSQQTRSATQFDQTGPVGQGNQTSRQGIPMDLLLRSIIAGNQNFGTQNRSNAPLQQPQQQYGQSQRQPQPQSQQQAQQQLPQWPQLHAFVQHLHKLKQQQQQQQRQQQPQMQQSRVPVTNTVEANALLVKLKCLLAQQGIKLNGMRMNSSNTPSSQCENKDAQNENSYAFDNRKNQQYTQSLQPQVQAQTQAQQQQQQHHDFNETKIEQPAAFFSKHSVNAPNATGLSFMHTPQQQQQQLSQNLKTTPVSPSPLPYGMGQSVNRVTPSSTSVNVSTLPKLPQLSQTLILPPSCEMMNGTPNHQPSQLQQPQPQNFSVQTDNRFELPQMFSNYSNVAEMSQQQQQQNPQASLAPLRIDFDYLSDTEQETAEPMSMTPAADPPLSIPSTMFQFDHPSGSYPFNTHTTAAEFPPTERLDHQAVFRENLGRDSSMEM